MNNSKMPFVKEHSAGGAVFKREGGHVLWLVQERAGHGYWQIPKGHIEKGETPVEAALREVKEESGITARAITNLKSSEYFFVLYGKRVFKLVDWFLMEYVSGSTNDFDPKEVSAAKFVPYKEAYNLIKYDGEKKVLEEATSLVKSTDPKVSMNIA